MKNIKNLFLLFLIPVLVYCQNLSPKINPKNFTFAILGDRTGSAEPEIFEQIIGQIDSLNTDFVINVGDLIEGYSKNADSLNSQWDVVLDNLKSLREKFYFTAGNHDALDSLSQSIYLDRISYKKTYYSFSIGKNHFVVLDNSQQDKIDKPDTTQLRWLNTTLAKFKKNDNIFCFMHRSFWKDAYTNNAPDTLHKLFLKYGADYVFSGHDHYYCNLVWDGIAYTQVGPSGSRYKIYKGEEFGAFQNFVRVSVKDRKVSMKVMKPDRTELAPDVVTMGDIEELENIDQAVSITAVNTSKPDSIRIAIKNILDIPISTECRWAVNNSAWQIIPDNNAVVVPAGEIYTFSYYLKLKSDSIYPLPNFTITYPYASGKKRYSMRRLMPVALSAECYSTNKTIKIDGKLDEKVWQNKKPIAVFGSGEGEASPTDPWQFWFAYDKVNLYIAGRLTDYEPDRISTTINERDDRVNNDDHINFILQPSTVSDTYYQFFVNANGAVWDRACYRQGKDSKRDTKWNSNVIARAQIAQDKKFSGWTAEALIPLKDFGITDIKAGQVWGFNLVRFQKRMNTVSDFSVPFEHNPKTFAKLYFAK